MSSIDFHWNRRDEAWIRLNELKRTLLDMDLVTATETAKNKIDAELSEACSIYNFECFVIGAIYNKLHRPAGTPLAREK